MGIIGSVNLVLCDDVPYDVCYKCGTCKCNDCIEWTANQCRYCGQAGDCPKETVDQ